MSSPIKSEALEIVSGGAANPKIVAGTADPTSGFSGPEGSVYLRYGAGVGKLYVKTGPATIDWDLAVVGPGGGGTLDTAYDFGGAGAGRIITADSGAVQIDALLGSSQAALVVNRTPASPSAAVGIDLSVGSNFNASGVGLQVSDGGAGTSIKINKSNTGSAVQANLSDAGAKALEVIVTAAPTSVSPVSVVANTTGTTADLLSISKIPGAATAGNALSVSMGANTTGSGVYVSNAGSGPALEVAAGSIQIANSAAAVSPSNTGRIRYNSGTQTFQVSLNGAAYADIATGAGFTLDIGDAIGSSTIGCVLFVGAGNLLAEAPASLFWDNTNNRLGVGTATPSNKLSVNSVSLTPSSQFRVTNNSLGSLSALCYAADNTSIGFDTDYNGTDFIARHASVALINKLAGFLALQGSGGNTVGNPAAGIATAFSVELATQNCNIGPNYTSPGVRLRIEASASSAAIEMGNGGTTAVSPASTGRLRYTTTGQKFQVSANGASYLDMPLLAAALTTGSVLFANSSGNLAQDNANLFWDDTNNRLGVGTNAPSTVLHVVGAVAGDTVISNNTTTGATANSALFSATNTMTFNTSGGALNAYAYYGDANATRASGASSLTCIGGRFRARGGQNNQAIRTDEGDVVLNIVNGTTAISYMTAGSLFFAGAGGVVSQDNANLFWDDTNNHLCLNTAGSNSNNSGFGGSTIAQLELSRDGAHATGMISSFGTSVVPQWYGLRGRGTRSAPAAVQSGDILAIFAGAGYGDGTVNRFGGGGNMQVIADEIWTTVSHGTRIIFTTVPSGSTAGLERFRITSDGAVQMPNGSTAAVSATSTGNIRYNSTGQKFQISANGAAYLDMPLLAAALTTGSVLFANSSGNLAQDNTNLFWDNTSKRLGIGTATPGYNLDIRSASILTQIHLRSGATTDDGGYLLSTLASQLFLMGGTAYVDPTGFIAKATTATIVGLESGELAVWGNTALTIGAQYVPVERFRVTADGATQLPASTAAVSPASTGRLRYTTTGQKFQASANGAAYLDVALLSGSLTTGSVLFASSGNILQDNANFFWDDTNNRLGIGTSAPGYPLDIRNSVIQSSIHIRSGGTGDDGGYILSTLASQLFLYGGGTYVNAVGHVAKATECSIVALQNGAINFTGDAGLTIGSAFSPTTRLSVSADGGVEFSNSSSAAVSLANAGKLRYTTTGQKFQISANGAAYLDVALMAAALTTGSIPFANSSGNLAQDNANLFWDDTNNRLGVGTASPGAAALDVRLNVDDSLAAIFRNNHVSGYSSVGFYDSTNTFKTYFGYSNASALVGPGKNVLYSAADFIIYNATSTVFDFYVSANNVGLEMANGGSAAVSLSNTGKLRYNTTGQKFQISANTAAYLDIALTAAALTTGSIPFANSSGNLAQDNANFFWDDTNNRLGIGTAAPAYTLDLQQNTSFYARMRASGAAVGESPSIILEKTKGTNASPTAVAVGNILGIVSFQGYTDSPNEAARIIVRAASGWGATGADSPGDMSFETTPDGSGVPVERLYLNSSGGVHIQTVGGSFLNVEDGASSSVSSANAGRLRYLDSASRFQVSKNTAAYEDVATLATAQTFTKSQNVSAVALTDAANIATDASLGNTFTVTLAGNRTLDNPTNLVAGGIYRWAVTQDGTGSRTLSYGTLFKWPGGTAPTLTTAAGAIDSITAIYDGSVLLANFSLNYS